MKKKDKDRKARANYKQKIQRLVIDLFPTDEDIKERIEYMKNAGEPKATYIKRLIREDISRDINE